MSLKPFIFILFAAICLPSMGQQFASDKDSLNNIILHSEHQPSIADAYVRLSEIYYVNNLDTMRYLCSKSLNLCRAGLENTDQSPEDIKSLKKTMGLAYNNLGYYYNKRQNLDSALFCYQTAAGIYTEIYEMTGLTATVLNTAMYYLGNNNYSRAISLLDTCEQIVIIGGVVEGRGSLFNTQGYIFAMQGKHSKALERYNKALDHYEVTKDSNKQAVTYNNIARLYDLQEEYEQSIALYKKSLDIHTAHNYFSGMSIVSNNLGHAYAKINQDDSAMYYYRKGLQHAYDLGYPKQICISLENIGTRYYNLEEYDSAYHYLWKARKLKLELKNKRLIGFNSKNMAAYFLQQNRLDSALFYAQEALDISLEIKSKTIQRYARKSLMDIYAQKGDFKNAYNEHVKYFALTDSIQKSDNQKAVLRNQYKFEYQQELAFEKHEKEKLAVEKELMQAQNEIQQSELNILRLGVLVIILLLMSAIIIFLLWSKNQKNKLTRLEAEIKLRVTEILKLQDELHQKSSDSTSESVSESLKTPLTEREMEVLQLICEGLTNKEIAEKIFLSVNTIKTHIQSLYVKLDVTNRTQAAIKGSHLQKT